MIYPKKNIIYKTILNTYVRWLTARHFHQISYNNIEVNHDSSILLIANHFSAWDTFILHHINRKLFKKRFHAMILERTLQKHPMLKYGGGFSVNKNNRSTLQSIDYASQLLREPGNLVLIYPQGKIYSNMVTDVKFERGVMRIIENGGDNFDIVFAASFVENFENFKPLANVHLLAIKRQFLGSFEQLHNSYQQHYAKARQLQTQIIKQ